MPLSAHNLSADIQRCDILFAGAGLAGLCMALEMIRRPFFQPKTLILVDRDTKQRNDRTWCFWATDEEPLPPILYHSWQRCRFLAPGFETTFDMAPYQYHMVRGLDFYRWADAELGRHPNVRRVTADIHSITPAQGRLQTSTGVFEGEVVLNSAFISAPLLPPSPTPLWQPSLTERPESTALPAPTTLLLQHFKGWLIETPAPAFDPTTITFMDFRIEQAGQTRFVYVLPLSDCRALVEFTVFSPALLPAADYDAVLRDYLSRWLALPLYRIEEEEFGVIPMADLPFPRQMEGRVIHIGTAGGFVKASSGYAFKRTLRRARVFAHVWEQQGRPTPTAFPHSPVFTWLDRILLRVLRNRNDIGHVIFTRLFQHLPPALVLRFLDEDSSLWENLRVVGAPPPGPFLQALAQLLWERGKKAAGL